MTTDTQANRYVAERGRNEAAVIDTFYKEVFCRVLAKDAWTGVEGAFARCEDIAAAFNDTQSPGESRD